MRTVNKEIRGNAIEILNLKYLTVTVKLCNSYFKNCIFEKQEEQLLTGVDNPTSVEM